MSSEEILAKGQSMKKKNIVGIVLWFTVVGIIVSLIISLIDSIIILSTNFNNEKLDDDKTLWGILGLLLLGNVACLIFANKMIAEGSKVDSQMNFNDFDDKNEIQVK